MRVRVPLRRITALAVVTACFSSSPVRPVAPPNPPDGHWATTTLALLQHGQERCDAVADRLLTHWRRLRGDGQGVRAALDRFLLDRATEDLAAAREALDLARGFLPRAVLEIDPATGAVLDQLYEAETDLCHHVALPAPPIDVFQRRRAEIGARIDDAEVRLGERLALPDEGILALQLEPYTGLIADAAATARRQMLEDREPPPPPRGPTRREKMAAWHQPYVAAALPSKLALRAYLESRRTNDAGVIQQACRDLQAAVLPLLADDEVFMAPDPDAHHPLEEIYASMRRLAVHCIAGRFPEADKSYRRMQDSLTTAASVLSRYGLRP